MSKKLIHTIFGIAISILASHVLIGQSSLGKFTFGKGEVLDVLLLSQNPSTEQDLKSYFQTAFPVAKRLSYETISSFKIESHTQGNLRPNNLIVAKWSDIDKRESFFTEILKEVPDFHERRRKIWSYFGLCYFEIKEDMSFEINRDKYNVATAYWLEEKNGSKGFYKNWKRYLSNMNGRVEVQLENGVSPFGYHYQPDYFIISSWDSEKEFRNYQEKVAQLKIPNIKHVNEFVLK